MSRYRVEPIRENEYFQDAIRNVQRVIFKGVCRLDTFLSRLWEGLEVLWTFHISGYLMKPVRNFFEDFKKAVRNFKSGRKRRKSTVLTHLFQGCGRDSKCSYLLLCQGNLWNQRETTRTSKEPSEKSKIATTKKIA